MPQRYPLAISTWSEEEIEAGCAQLRSGMTTMGAKVREFEAGFARMHGCKYAVMVNSGSSANLLMIAALVYSGRLPRGSRVAVPAVSWSTTYAPLEQFGMKIEVVDVDDSLNIDPVQIPDVDAIFAVNLLGNPCDFGKLPKSPILIEDNCESLGATYEGKWTGTHGVMGSHSLFFSHHISTMEGGVITTDDEELWRLLLMLRAHGWTRDLPEYSPGFHSFEFVVPGYSVRPTEVHAAIGLEQLKKLPDFLDMRRKNGAVYRDLIGHQREIGSSSWFGFAILTPNKGVRKHCRDGILFSLRDSFETRPIVAGNIMRHDISKHLNASSPILTMANFVHDCGFFVGNHHIDASADIKRLASALSR